eukprot:Lankesteria_metandrocarpae@DN7231_c0_g1_i1.p1
MSIMEGELRTYFGPARGFNPKEVAPLPFLESCARHLKSTQSFDCPLWMEYAKTAASRELSPYDVDWLYIRAASIMRKLFIRPDVGVLGLRKKYSKKGRRGTKPSHQALAGGKVIRHCLQQLEKMGLVVKHDLNEGRRLSQLGYKLVHSISNELRNKA